jgi:hypothetical protein
MTYAGAEFWDQFYRQLRETGDDLDWGGLWTVLFLVPLREAGARAILELGCGTGNDTARLTGEGYAVTAIDLSAEAIALATERFGSMTGRCAPAGCPRVSSGRIMCSRSRARRCNPLRGLPARPPGRLAAGAAGRRTHPEPGNR